LLDTSLIFAYVGDVKINPAALTEIRERSGFSKASFASLVGIAPSYLTEIEQGKKPGGPEVIKRMADALKCPIAALIRDPEKAASA
jgi:transcriptional regulator with XRE-family HTH domain